LASFGFDGFEASATVSSGELSSLTTDSLLTLFSQKIIPEIPPDLMSNVTFQNGEIDFLLPDGKSNYFISNGTTDTQLSLDLGYNTIPEPATLWLVGVGILLILCCKVGAAIQRTARWAGFFRFALPHAPFWFVIPLPMPRRP
jgi:PEP-CTERM motif